MRNQERQLINLKDLTATDVCTLLQYTYHLVNDYEGWIKIGTVLKAWDSALGLDLWDAWSSLGSGYNPREIPVKWRSFVGGVGVGYLIKEALRGGMPPDILKEISAGQHATRYNTLQHSNPKNSTTTPKPDKSDVWRLKAIKSLYADYRGIEGQGAEILAGYMRYRGIEFMVPTRIPTVHPVERVSISKEKQNWSGLIAEIRDCWGELRGYHVIFLEEITPKDPPKIATNPNWRVFRKAPIKREDQKKSYRKPDKTISGAGVWIKPTFPSFGKSRYETLAICEGIETAIALRELGKVAALNNFAPYQFLGNIRTQIVACLSAGNMPALSIPAEVRKVCLFVDVEPSRAGMDNAAKTAIALERQGIDYEIWLPPNADPSDPNVKRDWHDEAREILPLWGQYRATLARSGIVLPCAEDAENAEILGGAR